VESLNAPVPPAVERLAADLAPALSGLKRREDLSLLVKRFETPDPGTEKRARRALRGAEPCAARTAELGVFADPPTGPAPVVYLAVESPGLRAVHERLCAAFDTVPGLEGDGYVPHVTLARGADAAFGTDAPREVAARLEGRAVGPVTWTVDELYFRDVTYGEPTGTVSLPA